MRLISFGCSHTHGEGIVKDSFFRTSDGRLQTVPSEKSWAVQLSNMLGIELINLSRPGAGNNEIVKKILTCVPQENDIVVVQWTYFSRYTIFRDPRHMDITPTYRSKRDLGDAKSIEMFYKLFDDYNLAIINTMAVDYGYRILNSLNVPFVSKFARLTDLNNEYVNENDLNRACYYSSKGIHLDKQFLIDCQKSDFHMISEQVPRDKRYGVDGKHYSAEVHQKIAESYYNEITNKV